MRVIRIVVIVCVSYGDNDKNAENDGGDALSSLSQTNVYLVCRFTGWLVGRFDDLLVCPLAKLEVCMDMNIMFQNIVFKSVFNTIKRADTCIQIKGMEFI